jgi:HK97 family phage major capsid protein
MWQPTTAGVAGLVEAHLLGDDATLKAYREKSDEMFARQGLQPGATSAYRLPLTRDMDKSTAGAVVGTELDFASALFSASLASKLPMRRMEGLTGDLSLAAGSATTTVWQAGEDAEITASEPNSFGARALTPKSVGCVIWLTHQFRRQAGPAGNAFIEQQLARALAQAIDVALIDGSGNSGQPQGLLRASGTTSVSGSSLGWSGLRDLIEAAEGHDSGSLAFVAGVTAAKLLRSRETFSGAGAILREGAIDGIPCHVSRACPTDALLLAPWQSVVYATWGTGLEVTISPVASSAGFAAGKIGVRLTLDVDFVAEQAACIAKSTSIT